MNENQNLDSLLEDFLQENHVEDNGFTDTVMTSLPQQPRLIWVTHWLPVLGMAAGLLAFWKFEALHPQTVATWVHKFVLFCNVHIGSISVAVSAPVAIAVVAAAGYFAFQKLKDV